MDIKGFLKNVFDAMSGLDTKKLPVYEEMKKDGWKVDFAFAAMPFPTSPIMIITKPDGQTMKTDSPPEDRQEFQEGFERARRRLNLG